MKKNFFKYFALITFILSFDSLAGFWWTSQDDLDEQRAEQEARMEEMREEHESKMEELQSAQEEFRIKN